MRAPPFPTPPGATLQLIQSVFPTACPRCHLRLRNVRTIETYQTCPTQPTAPCPLCFNILHDKTLHTIIQQLHPKLSRITHDNRFKINSTLPVSASLIRDRAARLSLPSPLPFHVSLREAFKWALCPLLHQHYSMRYCPEAPFFIDVIFTHPESDPEANFLVKEQPSKKMRLATPSTTAVTKAAEAVSDQQFLQLGGNRFAPPPSVSTAAQVDVLVSVAPILFAASYTKLSRNVSQTPWFVDPPNGLSVALDTHEKDSHGRSKRTQLSVEDVVVSGIKQVLNPEKATFTAGGREDVDVRMLGTGRPFVVEVINSKVVPPLVSDKTVKEMAKIAAETSDSVKVHDLRVVSKEYFAQMKEFESEKRKCYRCVVWASCELDLDEIRQRLQVEGGFLLHQKTPLRVLHRRTQAIREKKIFKADVVRLVAPGVFVLDVEASAGTYIKEFVHGDNGRTVPNVASLLDCDADILQLDVVSINR